MIYDMMHCPEDFERHVDRSFGAAIIAKVFGQRGKTMQPGGKFDSFFKVEAQWAASLGTTSYPPLNSFPFLGSVPDWLTPWKGWKERALLVIKKARASIWYAFTRDTGEAGGVERHGMLFGCGLENPREGAVQRQVPFAFGRGATRRRRRDVSELDHGLHHGDGRISRGAGKGSRRSRSRLWNFEDAQQR